MHTHGIRSSKANNICSTDPVFRLARDVNFKSAHSPKCRADLLLLTISREFRGNPRQLSVCPGCGSKANKSIHAASTDCAGTELVCPT